jgi:hypothetical protein
MRPVATMWLIVSLLLVTFLLELLFHMLVR